MKVQIGHNLSVFMAQWAQMRIRKVACRTTISIKAERAKKKCSTYLNCHSKKNGSNSTSIERNLFENFNILTAICCDACAIFINFVVWYFLFSLFCWLQYRMQLVHRGVIKIMTIWPFAFFSNSHASYVYDGFIVLCSFKILILASFVSRLFNKI